MFWLEAKLGYIASVDWDGQKRKTIYVAGNKQALPQPFAITMSATSLFWTDWDTNSLYSYNISTDQVERLKVRGKLSPMDIRVFEPNRQPQGSSPCNQVPLFSFLALLLWSLFFRIMEDAVTCALPPPTHPLTPAPAQLASSC